MKPILHSSYKTVFCFVLSVILALSAIAATFNVNTTNDTHAVTPGAGTGIDGSGNISFRSALEAANAVGGSHTINVPAGTYNLTLGEITIGDIAQNITIIGAGAATTIINMTNTLKDRILFINSTGTNPNIVTVINNIQFTNGSLTSDIYGGGAIIAGGPNNSLTLNGCVFTGNSIAAGHGAASGGAVRYNGGGNLVIDNCTFNNNTNASGVGGAVSYFLENVASAGNGSVSITNSVFTNNVVSTTGGSGGALHIAAQGDIDAVNTFTVSVLKNTFIGNAASGVSGRGGAIEVNNGFAVGNVSEVHYNRFLNNTSTIAPDGLSVVTTTQGQVNADNNWWGCNGGPVSGTGCDLAAVTAGGTSLVLTKWLQLKHTASPSSVFPNGATTLTASFLTNNLGDVIAASNLTTLIGLPVSGVPALFSNAQKGVLSSIQTTIQSSGTATATYTANADACPPPGSADAKVDNATATASITIIDNIPPTITACPGNITDVSTDAGHCYAAVPFTVTADDNCPAGLTITCTAAGATTGTVVSGSNFNKGTTTVTCIAKDLAGNESQPCVFTITVVDKEAPVVSCPQNINLTGAEACSGIVNIIAATANDNCDGILTPVGTRSDGKLLTDPFPAGSTTITWTATDAATNTGSCTQTVTVNPEADLSIVKSGAPSVIAGTDVVYTITVINNGSCTAKNVTVTDVLPAVENFVSLSAPGGWVVSTPSVGSSGTILLSISSLDVAAGAQVFTLTVHVDASFAGTITNSAIVANSVQDPNNANNTAAQTSTVISSADLSLTKTGAAQVIAGNNLTYTITVTNSGPSDANNVSITDPLPAGETFVSLSVPAGWNATTPAVGSGGTISISRTSLSAADGPQIFTLTVNVSGNIANGAILSNTATATSSSSDPTPGNNAGTQSTTISNTADLIITKIAPPTVTAGGDIIYQIVVGNLGPNTATNVLLLDNFPPIPQITFGSIIAPPGWNPVSVPFLGTPGPFSIAFIKATLTPGEGPQVFIFVVHTIGNIANDILVNNTAVVSSSAQTFDPVSGNNTSTATTNIIACNIICPGDITVNTLPTDIDCGTIVTYPDATTTGSCGTLNYSKASGTFFPVGTTTVTVTSPATGQSCTFNVTVKDNTPPVPNCPTDYSVNADPGQCSATVSFLMTATDNCELISTSLGFNGPLSVGSHTFSKTFTDVSGNSASCSFTITVVDNQPPVITCQPDKTVNADAGKCYASAASVNLVNPTATDNCGSTSINGIRSDGKLLTDNYPTGSTVITWTATDTHSNTASCTQTITVKDNQPPTITGISATPSVLWPPNHTMRDVTISYTSADNCGIANCSLSVSSNEPIDGTGDGDTSPDWIIVDGNHLKLRAERSAQGNGRIYTITITCTDISGNSTSQTVNVVVSHNITAPLSGNSFKIGSTVNFAGTFWDKPGNKHTAQWLIDNTSVNGTVTEPGGLKNGTVTGSYKFGSAGVYKLQMNVKDQNGVVSYANTNGDMEAIVIIYDPNGGYSYGGGYFMSPTGALKANPNATGKVSYGFNSNYFKGATNPKGETQMQFQVGNLEFNAVNFDYLAISGAKAQFKGSGKIIGDQSGYNFIMTVIDGAVNGTGTDKIRLKIYNKNTGAIIYDNQPGASDAADPTTAVGNGSTVVIVNPTVTEINTITSATTTVEVKDGFHAQIFDAVVMPNPTTDNFKLQVITAAKEQIQVKVVDILGRQVKQIKFAPYQTIQFGSDLKKGIYMVEITQGTNHKVVKLQKL